MLENINNWKKEKKILRKERHREKEENIKKEGDIERKKGKKERKDCVHKDLFIYVQRWFSISS